MGSLLVAVVIVVATGVVVHRVAAWFRSKPFLVAAGRVLTGAHPDGRLRTDAGWFRPGTKPLTRTGFAIPYWHRPRAHRALINLTVLAAAVGVLWGWISHREVTELVLAALAVLWLGRRVRRVTARNRHKNWLLPLHLAAHDRVGIARAASASTWIRLEVDHDKAITGVTLSLPEGWPPDPKDKEWLEGVAAAKLGIESGEATWRHAGPKPQMILRRSVPLPEKIDYGRVATAVARAHSNEFVVGIGRKDQVVKASLSLDSPHFAINMGTGGGKSNLAALWLVQHLTRGGIAMVLDAKQFSHPWLFKDEGGDYAQLPNVSYCWTTEQIHDALVWLGEEVGRRNAVARRAVTASGSLRANVGPRILIIAEELNFVMPDLRQYWAEIRDPQTDTARSPALKGLGKVAFAGRAVKMNMVLIGQMLTAEVTGQRDSSVKENVGVTAMARYGLPGWRAAIGANVPMPPVPSVVGRVQLVTAGPKVNETQVPLGDLLMYRQMVLDGDMTPCPAGMPGAVTGTGCELVQVASDLPVSQVTRPVPAGPGGRVTLSEAVTKGIVKRSETALLRASHRAGFPPARGRNGLARLYDAVDLAEYDGGRRWDAARKDRVNV